MPNPEPPMLVALKAMTAALQEITPANGYRHDLSSAVFRGRMIYGASDPLPMVSIIPLPKLPEANQPTHDSARVSTLELLVQGFAEDDVDHPTDPAYFLLDDVERCLLAQKKRDAGRNPFGLGLKVHMEMGSGNVRAPDEYVADVAFFYLPVTLKVANDLLA